MKIRSFLLVLCMLFGVKAFCQQQDIFKRKPWEEAEKKFKTSADTKETALKSKLATNMKAVNNSVVKIKMKPVYLGDNGNGAYVFSMMPFNTPCLVPDSTFYSSMPVAKF